MGSVVPMTLLLLLYWVTVGDALECMVRNSNIQSPITPNTLFQLCMYPKNDILDVGLITAKCVVEKSCKRDDLKQFIKMAVCCGTPNCSQMISFFQPRNLLFHSGAFQRMQCNASASCDMFWRPQHIMAYRCCELRSCVLLGEPLKIIHRERNEICFNSDT